MLALRDDPEKRNATLAGGVSPEMLSPGGLIAFYSNEIVGLNLDKVKAISERQRRVASALHSGKIPPFAAAQGWASTLVLGDARQ
jgi:hypothetical protein